MAIEAIAFPQRIAREKLIEFYFPYMGRAVEEPEDLVCPSCNAHFAVIFSGGSEPEKTRLRKLLSFRIVEDCRDRKHSDEIRLEEG